MVENSLKKECTGVPDKRKLLIYAHYYVPDVASTGQILRELSEEMLDTFDITVICVVPSYEGTVEEYYKKEKYYKEIINGVKVFRIRVSEFSKDNTMSRIRNIFEYFIKAMLVTFRVGPQDFVLSISQPPILGGLIGVWGKWIKHAKYIYNIQDFNPEQAMVIGYNKNQIFMKLMLLFDKFSCRRSDIVITVGRDLVETMNKRFGGTKVPKTVLINNWIDEKEIYPLAANHEKVVEFKKKYNLDGKFVIMYSGNIGLYYDLENLITIVKQFRKGYTLNGVREKGPKTSDGREVVFAFVGNGSVMNKLTSYVQKHHFENVVFIPYQDKKDLIYSLNAGDVHWCVNAKGIKGVSVPSKAYGIMAAGKPILGVLEKETEIRYLIEDAKCGKCCDSGDYSEIANMIRWFINNSESEEVRQMGINGREYLVNNLTKDMSVKKYKEAILKS